MTREPAARVDLALEGMTCAACANRIERKLNKLDGVEASVNYATEQAAVRFDPHVVAVADLLDAVEAAGYRAAPAAEARTAVDRADAIRRRLVVAAALSGPLVVLAMATPAAVRRLGVARVRTGDTSCLLGRLRLPPRGARERAARRRDDGHPRLDRHARRMGLVGRGVLLVDGADCTSRSRP